MSGLRAGDCAVVLIDLQNSSVAATSTRPAAQLHAAAGALAELARLWHMPLLITCGRKPGRGGALIPELTGFAEASGPIMRNTVDAFATPAFGDEVARARRNTLLIAGVALDIGVAISALSARTKSHEVYVVAEACATTDALAETTAVLRLTAAGAHWIGFASLALELMADFTAPQAAPTQALVHRINSEHQKAHP